MIPNELNSAACSVENHNFSAAGFSLVFLLTENKTQLKVKQQQGEKKEVCDKGTEAK